MLKFIRQAKFWLPLLGLIAVEMSFRLGLWEPLAKPESYAGNSVGVKQSARRVGLDQISGITLGDSRTVYGFDHRLIYDRYGANDQIHVNLALGGSHLAGLRATADWALRSMPNLQRIVIGIAPDSMMRVTNGSYQVPLVEPFRSQAGYWQISNELPPKRDDLRSWGSLSAFMAYREDFADLLRQPKHRINAIRARAKRPALSRLAFSNTRQNNLCEYDLSSLASCRDQWQTLRAAGRAGEPAAQTFATYCQNPRSSGSTQAQRAALTQWGDWLTELALQVDLTVVLMPEHSLMQKPAATEQAKAAMAQLERQATADTSMRMTLIDQTALHAADECQGFSDLVHANQPGAAMATRQLLDALGLH